MLLFVYQVNLFHEQKRKRKKFLEKELFIFFCLLFPIQFNSVLTFFLFHTQQTAVFLQKLFIVMWDTFTTFFIKILHENVPFSSSTVLDFHHFLSVLCFCCCYIYCYHSFRVAPTICHERMFIHPCSLFWLECYWKKLLPKNVTEFAKRGKIFVKGVLCACPSRIATCVRCVFLVYSHLISREVLWCVGQERKCCNIHCRWL